MTPGALKCSVAMARGLDLPATLTLEEWEGTLAHFSYLCAYCQETPAVFLEHFVPVRHGGGTTAGNCLPSCARCNIRKGPRLPEAFAAIFGEERVERLRCYLGGRSTGQDVGRPPGGFPPIRDRRSDRTEIVVSRWTPGGGGA